MKKWTRIPPGTAMMTALALSLLPGWGQAEPARHFRFGADERIRQEYFDHIPVKAGLNPYAKQGENNYLRFRTRLWMEEDLSPDVTARVRLASECRSWNYPDVSTRPPRASSEWPDEWVLDNLYLGIRKLLDGHLDLRVGRQELSYGARNVIYDGTPGDGTRTLYFNAVKATWTGIPGTELDAFGIYNEPEDELAIHPVDRDLSGYPKSREGVTESGGGLYARNRSLPEIPVEAYLVFKREGEWEQNAAKDADGAFVEPSCAWQELDTARGVVRNAQLEVGTLGVRAMPSFTRSLAGEFELAGQVGQRGTVDTRGFMANAYLTYTLANLRGKPAIKGGISCLSGDDPDTEEDEGWNPVWARHTQWSDVIVATWDAEESVNRWSNLIAPSLEASASPFPRWKTIAVVSYLQAFEDDGSGDGRSRGWLAKWRNEFTFAEGWLAAKDKLTAHIHVEVLDPGDYYRVDDTAFFARWELNYAF